MFSAVSSLALGELDPAVAAIGFAYISLCISAFACSLDLVSPAATLVAAMHLIGSPWLEKAPTLWIAAVHGVPP
jgi:hypothetical protein